MCQSEKNPPLAATYFGNIFSGGDLLAFFFANGSVVFYEDNKFNWKNPQLTGNKYSTNIQNFIKCMPVREGHDPANQQKPESEWYNQSEIVVLLVLIGLELFGAAFYFGYRKWQEMTQKAAKKKTKKKLTKTK